MKLTSGTALQGGKYILNQPLGQGRLSLTFKATQAFLNKPVILKTICPQSHIPIDFAQRKQQFFEQARHFATHQHPGLVGILDAFEEAGLPFVVMDYVVGQSLAVRVQSNGILSESQALHYIRQVGSALSSLHRNALVHGDVKPENFIRPSGADCVVLVDGGLGHASILGSPESAQVLAGDGYAALELVQGTERLTAAADVYSLAASLYFLLTGQNPVPAAQRVQTALISPRTLHPGLSSAIESAILNGMELNRQARPQTIAAWFSLLPNSAPSSVQLASTYPGIPNSGSNGNLARSVAPSLNGNHGSSQPAITTPTTQVVVPKSHSTASPMSSTSKPLFGSLLLVSTVTALLGAGLGLTMRVTGATGPGSSFFHTEQDFPSLPDWPGINGSAAPSPDLSPPPQAGNRSNLIPEQDLPRPRSSQLPVRPLPAPEPELPPVPAIEASPTPVPTPTPTETVPPVVAPGPVAPEAVVPQAEPSPPVPAEPEPTLPLSTEPAPTNPTPPNQGNL